MNDRFPLFNSKTSSLEKKWKKKMMLTGKLPNTKTKSDIQTKKSKDFKTGWLIHPTNFTKKEKNTRPWINKISNSNGSLIKPKLIWLKDLLT